MADIKSQAELQEDYLAEFTAQTDEITDQNEGSLLDVISGVTSVAVREIVARVIIEFRKTFFETAHGPEVTGGPDDLQRLATDHFGSLFARQPASKSTGVVTFSRPNTNAGNVVITAGTVVKTSAGPNGVTQRFLTLLPVTMTGLSINASVEAVQAGLDGNVVAAAINSIETTLTDTTVVVTNAAPFAGGSAVQNDVEYREFIRNLIETLKGATIAAIEARAKTVAGVENATILEVEMTVKQWDVGGNAPVGDVFRVAYVTLYIADANGTASPALIDAVALAIETVRAAGVRVVVAGASPYTINWTAGITLNPSGPNYAVLASDTSMIEASMRDYVAALVIGQDFNVLLANQAILATWGPAGTGDLTSNGFITSVPTGNISVPDNGKAIPGVMTV